MKKFRGSIYQQELIGSEIEIVEAQHSGYEGIRGTLVDETKNTLVVESGTGNQKIIPKSGISFELIREDYRALLKGNKLTHRPEDRIKKSG